MLVAGLGGTCGAPASASRPATLTVIPAVGPPTTATTATGAGYRAGEAVTLYFDGDRVGASSVDGRGRFTTPIVVPAAARPGDHTLAAVGQSSTRSAGAGFVVRTDWSQGCFDAGRGCFNPYENVLDPATAGTLATAWSARVGTDGRASSVYADGVLFVGTVDGLVGVDPATGATVVHVRTGPVSTTPAVVTGIGNPNIQVVFTSTDGYLYAADTRSGQLLWQAEVGPNPTDPLLLTSHRADDIVAAVSGDTLVAFDPDGSRRWAARLEGGDIATPPAGFTAPSEPERVIVAAGNTLHALEAATGTLIWSVSPGRSPLGAPSIGNPHIIGNPNILVGNHDGNLFSIDRRSGATLATFTAAEPITASAASGAPNLASPSVFVGDAGGNVYAFEDPDKLPSPVWQATLNGPVDGAPVVANGVVYVGTSSTVSDQSELVALDAATGRVLLATRLSGRLASSPTVADGMVTISIASGDLVTFDGPDK